MGDFFKNTILETIRTLFAEAFGKVSGYFDFLFNPLTRWFVYFALFVALCTFIGFFLQFKWVRAALGGAILLAGAFVYGGVVMYREMQEKVAAEKRKKLPRRR